MCIFIPWWRVPKGWVYVLRIVVVSERTNKRHHHHLESGVQLLDIFHVHSEPDFGLHEPTKANSFVIKGTAGLCSTKRGRCFSELDVTFLDRVQKKAKSESRV
jgi:hypothetical protein